MMKDLYLKSACIAAALIGWTACVDTSGLEDRLDSLEDRVDAIEKKVAQINGNTAAVYALHQEGLLVMDVQAYDNNTAYRLEMSDGNSITVYVAQDGTGITPVIGLDQEGNWTLTMFEGDEPVIIGSVSAASIPQLQVSSEGYWQIKLQEDSEWENILDSDSRPIEATGSSITDSFFEEVVYDEEENTIGITMKGGETLSLEVHNELITMEVEGFDLENGETLYKNQVCHFYATFSEDVVNAYSKQPDGWNVEIRPEEEGGPRHVFIVSAPAECTEGSYEVKVYLESEEHYLRVYRFTFDYSTADINASDSETWNKFKSGADDNVLLDFSYAGYKHGEVGPPDVTVYKTADGQYATNLSGYTVYNIEDYGAVGTDEESDRQAFLDAVSAALGTTYTSNENGITFNPPKGDNANAIVYIPEGNFILHSEEDNIPDDSYEENAYSQTIIIRASNFILKGADRTKSRIIMKSPLLPSGPNGKKGVDASRLLYASPDMIQIKHNTGVEYKNVLASVTGDSPKGSFEVTVGSTAGLAPGQWVCLYMAPNPSDEAVSAELDPHEPDGPAAGNWAIAKNGVTVEDFHQIKSVSGNRVTFHEPLMHEVCADFGWTILNYKYYQNNGIEDLTFVGDAKEDFVHHASWQDDGGYKPVSMTRMVNSWMRRVDFESVSEACSIISSANVSVFDSHISGKRGHSSIRSQGSSRVFIGKVTDNAYGKLAGPNGQSQGTGNADNTGQYHATGVSKLSMGAVLWNNVWGDDSCFESHASQPRATLVDICKGGFMRYRQGGDETQVPNHLNDLTIWNFEATNVDNIALDLGAGAKFIWWDAASRWWKILPPVIVGFHGQPVTFDESPEQIKVLESNGNAVTPNSLYEAQLINRLGYVPAWLQMLK